MFKKRLISMIVAVIIIFAIMPMNIFANDAGKIEEYQIISTGFHTVAIKTNGELWAWGRNIDGKLGDGTTIDKHNPVKIMENVASVSAGGDHTVAIKTDGSLWVWGGNEYGQLGDGSKTDKHNPVKIMENVASVSAGGLHTVAIKTNGELWAWGYNEYGQLGDNTTTDKHNPVKIMDNVASVSAGYSYTMAIKTNGELWAWGWNWHGNLGDGTKYTEKHNPVKIMDNVASVSAGQTHTMAIKTNGELWAWGSNLNGSLGDGTVANMTNGHFVDNNNKIKPIKIMDNVANVSASYLNSTMAIKTNGELWVWGLNDCGQLGDGTTIDRCNPIKIMDNVEIVEMKFNSTMAVKTNGELWAWGSNKYGQLGDNTTIDRHSPVKITNSDTLPSDSKNPDYIYDAVDPGTLMNLSFDKLASVTDKETAVFAVQSAASGMTAEQKQSTTGIDLVTLYAEEATAQAASTTVSGNSITIDQTNIQTLQTTANDVKTAVEKTLVSANITIHREMNADVKFKTNENKSITITIDPSAAKTTADNVRVETPDYIVTFSAESIKNNAKDSPLIVTITEIDTTSTSHSMIPLPTKPGNSFAYSLMASTVGSSGITMLATSTDTKTYNISFNKPIEENVKVSLPPASGDPTYQAVTNSQGDPVGGKYNPITNKLEAKIKNGGTYTVKENKKNFSDISSKSKEMQDAINILASKGIISGTSATTFSPDSPITRAEIAALITRTLSKYDANNDGKFNDVKKADWFFGAAGSAKKHNIMNGTSATTFAPKVNIPKDQIVCVAARVLRNEMRYKDPANVNNVLSVYKDAKSLAEWSLTDLALATRENLIVKRGDGNFNPTATMIRGDAAIILYRMFIKIW